MGGRVAPQPVAEQHVLEFLHEHGQDAVGVGDGEGELFRAAEPHEAVGQPVRVQAREHRYRRQRDGGHLEGEHQQRRHGGGIAPEEPGGDQQVTGLGKDPHRKEQQHQPRHPGQQGGDHDQHKAAQQKDGILHEPGHQPEKEIPHQQHPGIPGGNDGIVVAVGVFEHLIAQKIHGEFVQDVFRQFLHHTAFSPSNWRRNSGTV